MSPRTKTTDRPFEAVWKLVRSIPRGRVATYGQLSSLIAGRLTPVGVGWAIRAAREGTIPWHRVVAAGGRIATDRAHPGLQREMLESERVRFDAAGNVDLARHAWATAAAPREAKATAKVRSRRGA
jgi:methylated-DNA-protein-cysteine methyltransferase-like protein